MASDAFPLTYCGEVVGTYVVDDEGVAHGFLDPDKVTEEELDHIFGNGVLNFSISRRKDD